MTTAATGTRRRPPSVDQTALAAYVLGLGDDALILAQRLGEWITRAPQIEEDIALGNIALDLLGQARTLLSYAGELEGAVTDRGTRTTWPSCGTSGSSATCSWWRSRTATSRSPWPGSWSSRPTSTSCTRRCRPPPTRRCPRSPPRPSRRSTTTATTPPNGCSGSATAPPESHDRMQAALDQVWPYVEEIFEATDTVAALPGIAADPAALRPAWSDYVENVSREATLTVPTPKWRSRGGRTGYHTEHLGHLLPEMQNLHRSHPGATW